MAGPPRVTTRKLYFASLGIYAASFALPAVIDPSPTPGFGWVETWGWEAAIMTVMTPMIVIVGPSNFGYIAAALLVAFGSCRAAIGCSVVALLSMAYCGIALPPQPGGGPIRWPGGSLGPGYYLWLGAGVMMLVCGVRACRERRNAPPPGLGLRHVPVSDTSRPSG
jgi:hypothetical protein